MTSRKLSELTYKAFPYEEIYQEHGLSPDQELIGLRTRNSKTFLLPSGRFHVVVDRHSLHVPASGRGLPFGNAWEDIDRRPDVAPSRSGYDWQFSGLPFRVRVRKSPFLINLRLREDEAFHLDLQPLGLYWAWEGGETLIAPFAGDQATASIGEVSVPDALGKGNDVSWRLVDSRVRKVARLVSLPEEPRAERLELRWKIDLPTGATLRESPTGLRIVWRGREVAELPRPWWESEDGEAEGIANIWLEGDSLTVSLPAEVVRSLRSPLLLDTDVDEQVGYSADDARENKSDTSVKITAITNQLNYYEAEGFHTMIGLRFRTVAIPRQAVITNAYLRFKARYNDDGAAYCTIYGEDSAAPAVFAETNRNISNRPSTAAGVLWAITTWVADTWYNSPDISEVVQEIVNRSDWDSNDNMVLIVDSDMETMDGKRAWSWDSDASSAPKLHVEYTGIWQAGSFPAYIRGLESLEYVLLAYTRGLETTTDNFPAFLIGSTMATDSFPAFLVGIGSGRESFPAYARGHLASSDSFPSFLFGVLGAPTESFPAFVVGRESLVSSLECYLAYASGDPDYQVWALDENEQRVAIIPTPDGFSWEIAERGEGSFELKLDALSYERAFEIVETYPYIQIVRGGQILKTFLIENDEPELQENGQAPMAVRGPTITSMLDWRVCVPASGTAQEYEGHPDDAIKWFVRQNFQAGYTSPERVKANLSVQPMRSECPQPALEVERTWKGSYTDQVSSIIDGISRVNGVDFELFADGQGRLSLETFWPFRGVDRTEGNKEGNREVKFTVSRGNVPSLRSYRDRTKIRNAYYIVGLENGDAGRIMVTVQNDDSINNWGRREAAIDAQGETDTAKMRQAGLVELSYNGVEVAGVTFAFQQTEALKFQRDFDIGDYVTVYYRDFGVNLARHWKIVRVKGQVSGNGIEDLEITLGRDDRDLFDWMQEQERKGGGSGPPKLSDDDPTWIIAHDTEPDPGESTEVARIDHLHGLSTDAPYETGLRDQNIEDGLVTLGGSKDPDIDFAKASHQHNALDNVTPEPVAATGSSGTSWKAARRDHVHSCSKWNHTHTLTGESGAAGGHGHNIEGLSDYVPTHSHTLANRTGSDSHRHTLTFNWVNLNHCHELGGWTEPGGTDGHVHGLSVGPTMAERLNYNVCRQSGTSTETSLYTHTHAPGTLQVEGSGSHAHGPGSYTAKAVGDHKHSSGTYLVS